MNSLIKIRLEGGFFDAVMNGEVYSAFKADVFILKWVSALKS